jgi:hypothetical protein
MLARSALVGTLLLLLLTCCPGAVARTYEGFSDPQPVSLSGYTLSAMEPEISPDGDYLLFNTSNVAPGIPALELATRTGPGTFEYDGALHGEGVNEPGQLSGTPSLDREGDLYFVSPRSYPETLSSVYTGRFIAGAVTDVHLLAGVSGETPGMLDFDVAVSPDGASIFASVGDFRTGSLAAAHIALFERSGAGFVADPASTKLLHAVNRPTALDYAAAVSSDGLELFFTRAIPAKGAKGLPAVYRASRSRTSKPFGHVQRVGAISGFAEAPSLSDDGTVLYYHQLVGSSFRIMSVSRAVG